MICQKITDEKNERNGREYKRNFFKTVGCIEKVFEREGGIYKIFKSCGSAHPPPPVFCGRHIPGLFFQMSKKIILHKVQVDPSLADLRKQSVFKYMKKLYDIALSEGKKFVFDLNQAIIY
jgi:hypothetical protein